MSKIADEKKKQETYTIGSYNCSLALDGQQFEVLTVEGKSTEAAFVKIIRMYPLLRSKYLDDKLGWEDANLLVESLQDESYEVDFDSEKEPLVLGKHEIEIPISGEEDKYKVLTGTFYKRMIV